MTGWLTHFLAVALTACLFLGGLVGLGHWAGGQLRDHDRYAVLFADVVCDPPPGSSRADFLEEVQYLAALPDRLQRLDDGLAGRLAEAFAKHPWVETVQATTGPWSRRCATCWSSTR